jgi:hypothetical protein
MKTMLTTSLLLVLAGYTLAEPLTFGMFEGNQSRREKFEKKFVIGDKLQVFEVGKKSVLLPPGNWLISEVSTGAPDVVEEGSSTVISETAEAWLAAQDPDSGDTLVLNTNLAPLNPHMSFTQLVGPCKAQDQVAEGWAQYAQQRDMTREDRQSCVRTSVRLHDSRSGQRYLQLRMALVESWKAEFLIYQRMRNVPVSQAQTLDTLLADPALGSYLANELQYGIQLKNGIARQMGW